MHITEVIIDGFKSYASRTVISGWDPEFNAITGLNGTGKSNILDSICFVLGISNLTQVRAANLQDLVYKRGQAGITKASVTIVFENNDPRNCPVGYEDSKQITVTRQIVLGGRNKYLINGHNVQQKAVANLFQSVQLNVNNPHFLIMQGRITKVLNMKPAEILSMIEEAAGTRMFEDKKDLAVKTMEKKDKKLDEISQLLNEEIVPKLDKLRKERSAFLEYQKIDTEVERLRRLVVAYQYTQHVSKLSASQADLDGKTSRMTELEKAMGKCREEKADADASLARVRARRDKEARSADGKRDKRVERLGESLVRVKTQVDLKQESIREDEAAVARLKQSAIDVASALEGKLAGYATAESAFALTKQAHDAKADEVKKADELLSALSTGMSSDSSESSYEERLQGAKAAANAVQTETKQAQIKLEHARRDLKEKEAKGQSLEKADRALATKHDEAAKAVEELEKSVQGASGAADREKQLTARRDKDAASVARLRQDADAMSDRLSRLQFVFSDPSPNFNRRAVKGLVANLVTLSKENMSSATAVEVAAGGRLYSVVVETEVVGKQLLENGRLKKRVTIIPLNKIQPPRAAPERVARAKSLAPGRVDAALSLVGYSEDVSAAMAFVFGNTLVCRDKETAKLVTFDEGVQLRSVTLEGDVYDPKGTLTGGSSASSASVLAQLAELRDLRAALARHEESLAAVETELRDASKAAKAAGEAAQALELKQYELRLLKEQLSKSAYGQMRARADELRAEIAQHEAVIAGAEARGRDAQAAIRGIEAEMKDLAANREGKLKSIKSQLAAAKKALAELAKGFKAAQQSVTTLKLEIEQMREEVASMSGAQLAAAEEALARNQAELAALEEELAKTAQEYAAAKAELQEERDRLAAVDEEIGALEAAGKRAEETVAEFDLEHKRLAHEVGRFQKDRAAAESAVAQLEKQYEWVREQRQHFGASGTAYDYNAQNPSEARKRLDQLEETHSKLSKSINRKVMNMLDRVEKEEQSLKKKLAIVLNDKTKIEETIVKLDVKKREALQNTWEKVNKDFGVIFGDLLPGNTAKLDVPEGQDITEGLEIRVNLGGVWKQSLTELSGGQRSLVALSLILSLLSYKPAPLYILDEIDAALDLSHTQNIGQLLKTRFHGAQFIVVSLKEGMFTNANVLFRTKFRDGTSVVERFAAAQAGKGKA